MRALSALQAAQGRFATSCQAQDRRRLLCFATWPRSKGEPTVSTASLIDLVARLGRFEIDQIEITGLCGMKHLCTCPFPCLRASEVVLQ